MEGKAGLLLEELAKKSEVTVECLWKALLKQAPIYGVISLVQIILVGWALFFVIRSARRVPWKDGDNHVFRAAVIVLSLIVLVVWAATIVSNLSIIAASLLNPEYWALDRVLSIIKKCR